MFHPPKPLQQPVLFAALPQLSGNSLPSEVRDRGIFTTSIPAPTQGTSFSTRLLLTIAPRRLCIIVLNDIEWRRRIQTQWLIDWLNSGLYHYARFLFLLYFIHSYTLFHDPSSILLNKLPTTYEHFANLKNSESFISLTMHVNLNKLLHANIVMIPTGFAVSDILQYIYIALTSYAQSKNLY